jgi:UDP-galactopyranose mutase
VQIKAEKLMQNEMTQTNNNLISNGKLRSTNEGKQSPLAESQAPSELSLHLSSFTNSLAGIEAFCDTPDIVCLSHLRWNFVYQRPQHLLSRFAQGRRVFFIEEPIFSQEPLGRLEVSEDKSGVVVVVPHLPTGLSQEGINADLQVLIDGLFAENNIRKYICWYYTPMAIAFWMNAKNFIQLVLMEVTDNTSTQM